jgi:hypothetical protein
LAVRLRNQKYSHKILGLSTPAWWELLRLALDHGWQPMGGVLPELPTSVFHPAGLSMLDGEHPEREQPWNRWEARFTARHPEALLETYLPFEPEPEEWPAESRRLVLLEDALNLVDALDRAYLAYEPQRVPASYFLFEPDDPALRLRPSLGALAAAIDVCRQGPFSIEPWRY